MKIQNRYLFALSMLLLVATAGSAIAQLVFISHAEHATGVVRDVRSEAGRCGRYNAFNCTKYKARVEVQSGAGKKSLLISAGRVKGYGQPLYMAQYRVGDSVPVVFDPQGRGYRDSPLDVWGLPLILLLAQLATLGGSLIPRRGRREPEGLATLKP